MMTQKQWKLGNSSSVHVNGLTDSFAVLTHLFNHFANPPTCIAAIYANNKAAIEKRCPLQIRNTNSATIPTPNYGY